MVLSVAEFGDSVISWAPPIPSIGRGGQRANVPHGASLNEKLRSFYLHVECVPDFFVRKVPARYLREHNLYSKYRTPDIYLSGLEPVDQYRFIRSRMYGSGYSLHFKRKLSSTLKSGGLSTVRQWFYTANGVVLPYIMGGGDNYEVIDSLTKFVMENCASNYAQFISSLKTTKKLMRKSASVNNLTVSGVKIPWNGKTRMCSRYVRLFNERIRLEPNRKERFRSLLLWTQSRATGLADSSMVRESLTKFQRTTLEPSRPVMVEPALLRACIRTQNLTGHEAQVSCGPKACLQAPQKGILLEPRYYAGTPEPVGGQTRYLLYLATHRVLHGEYDLKTLEVTRFEKPRTVRSAKDLLSWAIQESLTNRVLVNSVRYHAVAEQSKSRSITVAHYAYQCIMGVLAHALTPSVLSAQTKSGLSSDRHLWNFLDVNLQPEAPSWDGFSGHRVQSMSSDLSEATDHLNWWFVRSVWSEFIRQTRGRMQPTALMMLAKTLFTSSRTVYFRDGAKFNWFRTHRGSMMGDLFTKVVLTIAQDYNARKALLDSPIGSHGPNKDIVRGYAVKPYNIAVASDEGVLDTPPKREIIHGADYSIVGDDIVIIYIVISSLRGGLLPYFRKASTSTDVLLSEHDSFDSPHLMFYCEEGAMVPQSTLSTPRHERWRGRDISYLDYPRLRLLLPVKMEQDIYSHTNVGRVSLLGKEARWVNESSNARVISMYEIAQLVQHVLVPRDIEILCPFTPNEIGGDGSYINDPDLLWEIIHRKSHDPAETLYRMECQMMKLWSHHYVSTDKTRLGVLKHHLILPTLDRLRAWLPERAVIVPPSVEHAEILRSLPRGILESPLQVFMKLVKRCYYSHLFRGKLLPSLRVKADVASKRGATRLTDLERWFDRDRLVEYLSRWRRPGFSTRDDYPYYVVPYRHKDIMSVSWQWKPRAPPATELARVGVNDFLDVVLYGKPSAIVTQRLNMFFESDPLIIIRVRSDTTIKGRVCLVSQDARLGSRISTFIRSNRDRTCLVELVHPAIFLLGRLGEIPHDVLIEDAGSINFFGRSAADSNIYSVECNPLEGKFHHFLPGVRIWRIQGLRNPRPRPSKIIEDPDESGFIGSVLTTDQRIRWEDRELDLPVTDQGLWDGAQPPAYD